MRRPITPIIRSYFLLRSNYFNYLGYHEISRAMAVFRFGEFRVDPASRRLDWQDNPVSLTAKQFDLLVAFLDRPGVPLTKQELQSAVWPDVAVEENNLTQHVFQLRKALAAAGGETVYIETLPKIGYQFVAAVRREDESLEAAPVPPPSAASFATRPRHRVRWMIAGVAVLLFAGTLGFGKRQWDFWMAIDPPYTDAPKTIAVMPFGSSPVGAAFAAEVAANLGRLDNIRVQVVQPLAGGPAEADFTLSGTVQASGTSAKAVVSLRHGGESVWEHDLDGELADLTAEVTGHAAATLEERGGARRRHLLSRKAPANREAYLAYLEGAQALTSRRGSPVDHFQRAIVADPQFPGAYSGLALYYMLVGFNQAEEPRLIWERAREYSRKALELEPENGEARVIQAYVAAYADQDEARAERLAREVLQSDPGSTSLQLLAGQLLSRVGKFTEAEAILRQAVYGDPTLLLARQVLAHHYYLSRQHDLSKREAWRIIRMAPKNGTGYGLLVPPAWASGDWRLASLIASRAKAAGLNQPMVSMGLAYTYGRTGRVDEARRIVNTMNELSRLSHVSLLQRAVAHAGIGENDEAVRLMRSCLAVGCVNPSLPRLDPVFDSLRDHPGFVALVR